MGAGTLKIPVAVLAAGLRHAGWCGATRGCRRLRSCASLLFSALSQCPATSTCCNFPRLPSQELFDEYQRALRLPGTPIKTFRLRLFLFPAAEDPFTPEELAYLSTSRSSSADKLGRDAAAAAAASLGAPLPGSKESSLARAFARVAGPGAHTRTPSSFSSELSCSSAPEAGGAGAGGSPDGTATPSAGDTELAWEAGFRAGQQAALAAQEEWQALVAKRMQYLGHVQSDYILSAADAALGAAHGWPEVGCAAPPAPSRAGL